MYSNSFGDYQPERYEVKLPILIHSDYSIITRKIHLKHRELPEILPLQFDRNKEPSPILPILKWDGQSEGFLLQDGQFIISVSSGTCRIFRGVMRSFRKIRQVVFTKV